MPARRLGSRSAGRHHPYDAYRSGHRTRRRRRRRSRTVAKWVGLSFLLLFVLAVVGGVFLVMDARTAYAELRSAEQRVSELQAEALAGDREDVESLAGRLQAHTTAARDSLTGPHWTVAGWLPWAGPNVRAVQDMAFTVDDLSHHALGDLVDAVWAVDPANLAPEDGRIDIGPIAEVAPKVVAADAAIQQAAGELGEIDTEPLFGPIATAVNRLTGQVDEIASLTTTAARAVQLVPPMMGADGPREYLVLVQTNAEPRATGGIAGQTLLLRADDGAVELVDQQPASGFGRFDPPVAELTEDELRLYSDRLGRDIQNVNRTPDFPRAAELARAMWRERHGVEVDGVLAIDPVALGSLLEPAGAISLPTGQELNAENAARLLLNEVYIELPDPQDQDDFFAVAADAIADAVLNGGADPAGTVQVLDRMASDGRLLVWSAHEEEQDLLSGTTLSGELRGHHGRAPVIGVYVNEMTAAKISYYQHLDVSVEPQECRADGSRSLGIEITVRSEVPDEFRHLPQYLIGRGSLVPIGDIRSQIVLYAPTGATIHDLESDAVPGAIFAEHQGLEAASAQVTVSPGEEATLSYRLEVPAELPEDPELRVTPGPADGQFAGSASPCAE